MRSVGAPLPLHSLPRPVLKASPDLHLETTGSPTE
jgi:hypothetical protein